MKKSFIIVMVSAVMASVALSQLVFASPYAYFSDVTSTHYNATAINWLAANGVVQGYSDGTFRPDSQINRAEFLKMLYETIGMVGYDSTELRFIDVPSSEWYVKYVKEAFATGVVDGYPDGTFRPANYINFVEAVKIVMNGFFDVDALYGDGEEYIPCAYDLTPDYPTEDYVADMSAWYWKYLHVAEEMCLIDDGSSVFGLWGIGLDFDITRADMAELLYRAKTLKDNEELTVYNDSYEPASIVDEEGGDDEMMDDEPLTLTSSAFVNNGTIPAMYTCDGTDTSVPLTISNIPSDAQSLALIVDDPDAPSGSWIHWLVWNINPDAANFSAGSLPDGAISGTSGSNIVGYEGPCPPLEDGAHRYFFDLYALDTELSLASGSTRAQLEAAMATHILETAQIIGLYDAN